MALLSRERMIYPGCAVRVRDLDGLVVGAGVLVLGRYVLTCAHVVADALRLEPPPNKPPVTAVVVDVPPFDDDVRQGLLARVVAWRAVGAPDGPSDIAVLALDLPTGIKLTGGIGPGDLQRLPPKRGTRVRCWGYPQGYDDGLEADALARDPDGAGTIHLEPVAAEARFVEGGYSGGPVVPDATFGAPRLVGISVRKLDDNGVRRGFVIPSQKLCQVWPPLAQPYRGLEAFKEEDADLFFGRDLAVDELQSRLAERPFVTVLGPSGAGKSSVVRAGLAHALRTKGWEVAACRPDADPALDLWEALVPVLGAEGAVDPAAKSHPARDPVDLLARVRRFREASGARGVLVILDQFEQLFTLEPAEAGGVPAAQLDEAEARMRLEYGTARQRDLVRLLEAIARQDSRDPPLVAVATLRADFLGSALRIGAMKRLLDSGDVKLGPMGADELAAAILKPAKRFGVEVEGELVARMVADMARQPGGLPFLQVALEQLWTDQQVPAASGAFAWEINRTAYGGLETAIDAFAESALARLSSPQQFGSTAEECVKRVLMRLVRLGDGEGDGTPDARAIATRAKIGEADWPVAQALARERLLTLGARTGAGADSGHPLTGETAEIAHEALLTGWERLKLWIADDRDFGRWRQRLEVYLSGWSGRPDDADLPAPQLGEAVSYLQSRSDDLNANEREFINAASNNAKKEATRLRRQIRLLIFFVALLLAAVGAVGYFWIENERQFVELEKRTEVMRLSNSIGLSFSAVSDVANQMYWICSTDIAVLPNGLNRFRSLADQVSRSLWTIDPANNRCETLLRVAKSAGVWTGNPSRASKYLEDREVKRALRFVELIDYDDINAMKKAKIIVDVPFPYVESLIEMLNKLRNMQ